jgi:hypothetical protein
VSASTRLVAVGARVGRTGGTVSAYVGERLVGTWDLHSSRTRVAWHSIGTQGLSGPVVLRKTGAGSVVLDGLEVRARP